MHVLIIQGKQALATLWERHLHRLGVSVHIATDDASAREALHTQTFNLIIADVVLNGDYTLPLCDLAQYRQPQARVLFATASSFFSDGSLFTLVPNACAVLHSDARPDDIAAVAAHYATNHAA